jgi:cell division protein FtsA
VTEKKANFVCLDVGSHKIATLAARIISETEVEIMDHGLYASSGIKCGVVVDAPKAESAISNALNNLEQKIKHHVDTVVVSFSGAKVRSSYMDHSLKLDNRPVSKNDLSLLIAKSVRGSNNKDSSVVHCFPVEFLVDGVKVRNPSGMVCEKLSASLHVVTADSAALSNLSNCFAKSHVRVEEFALSPIASGLAYFASNPQDKGALLIDCGAMTTSVTVFYDNVPVFLDYLPIGGWHISNDIAQVLGLDFANAERLKVLYANVSEDSPSVTLDLDIYDQEKTIDAILLNEVVKARITEILSLLKVKYEQLENVDSTVTKNVALTGGSSSIKGMEHLGGSVLHVSRVRNFARHYTGSLVGEEDIQSYSAVLGMLSYRMRHYVNYYSSTALLTERASLFKKFIGYLRGVF